MIAAWKILVLLIEQPPGNVDMTSAQPIGIMPRNAFERGNISEHAVGGSVSQMLSNRPRTIRQSIRKACRLRVEQQARRLAGAGRKHYRAAADLLLGHRDFIDVRNSAYFACIVQDQFTSHCTGHDCQPPSLHCREDHRLARTECRSGFAAAAALPAVVARGTAIDRFRNHRLARRYHRNPELLRRSLHQHFMYARLGRRQKLSIGSSPQPFVRTRDTDEFFGFIEVG